MLNKQQFSILSVYCVSFLPQLGTHPTCHPKHWELYFLTQEMGFTSYFEGCKGDFII